MKIKSVLANLIKHNYYSLRRSIIWPEENYKRGMLKRIQKIYKCKYFIETGTYLGETPLKLKSYFDHIWTIELDAIYFNNANKKLSKYANISCMHGDSKDILPKLVKDLDSPCLFWLDGHYSGGRTAQGVIKAPILQEIEAIGNSRIKTHIIVIDDISDFSIAENNTPLSKILLTIDNINSKYKYYFDYDMLFVLPFERERREFWKNIAFPIVIR
jgi:hypothetical protein